MQTEVGAFYWTAALDIVNCSVPPGSADKGLTEGEPGIPIEERAQLAGVRFCWSRC
jgi:hypothetical protein